MLPAGKRSLVTLSGLLNVLDGVGSEEGKIFFATVSKSPRSCLSHSLIFYSVVERLTILTTLTRHS